jgi:hypothetical protein
MRLAASGVRINQRTGASNGRLINHRSLWLVLWLSALMACARSAVPESDQVSGVVPLSGSSPVPTAHPTATIAIRSTSVPTTEPESGPLSHTGSGSLRTLRFHLRAGHYAIDWEAQPLLPSGIGCSLRGSLQPTEGAAIGQFEDQVFRERIGFRAMLTASRSRQASMSWRFEATVDGR